MHRRVAHDAFGAHAIRAGFELRFDQRHGPAAGLAQGKGGGQHGAQADEAGVADHGAYWIGDQFRGQMPGVGAFVHHHAGVAAQFPGELPVPHVHGVHAGGAMG